MAALFGIALVFSAIGFLRLVYFISVGYAFSIAAMAAAVILWWFGDMSWLSLAQNLLLLTWGLRLGIFLVQRERRTDYSKITEVHERSREVAVAYKALIWVTVALLYVAMFSPSLFAVAPLPEATSAWVPFWQGLGVLVMAGGLTMEALADKQKSDFKAVAPSAFCNVGLYSKMRCPNYMGEILFWVGNFVAGMAFYMTGMRWMIALVGLVCLVLIMLGSAKRLEESQTQRYGAKEAYRAYIATTPVLVPFVPIYTLKNLRVYLG
jgi:steroid 5-alpha reductase family enzyme